MDRQALPSFDELPVTPGAPPQSSWGLWGPNDRLGCLNLLTPDRVVDAIACVRTGESFGLNWALELPDPPLFGRSRMVHEVLWVGEGAGHDEVISSWNTQSSSQWDGFRHVRHERYGFYNGIADEDHGVDHWAPRGIVGRCVLADVGRHRESIGRPLVMDQPDIIEPDELLATLEAQRTEVRTGDVLLIRTGWVGWYSGLASADRLEVTGASPGLRPGRATARVLWDMHIAAVAADNCAVELLPTGAVSTPEQRRAARADVDEQVEISIHRSLLPLLGLPMGELFVLDALADACSADGRYEGLFVSAPLNVRGGVATPPNAVVIR